MDRGILFITNRIGNDARLMPGRTLSAETIEAKLKGLALEMVQVRPWQAHHDLALGYVARLLHPGPRKGHRCRVALPGVWFGSDAAR